MEEDWDVNKYYNKFEPNEQWEMKKKFMETHKNVFSEERVVCLAQVLVNIEFLGTRYPAKTMKIVAELSHGIVDDFHERQKTRLQRTFVGAEDATKAKYNKGEILKTTSIKLTKAVDDDKKHLSTDKVSVVANGSDANYCVLQKQQQKTGKRKLSESVSPLENGEQVSKKTRRSKKKKPVVSESTMEVIETATNIIEITSNGREQEAVEDNNSTSHQLLQEILRLSRERKKIKKAERKKAAMEEKDRIAKKKIEEGKDVEKEQPLENNKKKKSSKKIVEVDAVSAEKQLPQVSSKKKKSVKKIDQEDVKEGPVAGKQTISEPPRSSLQKRLLAIAGLETVLNDRSEKKSNCTYKPIPRFVLIKLSKQIDQSNSPASVVIQNSAQLSGIRFEIETCKDAHQKWQTTIYLDRQLVAQDVDEKKSLCIKNTCKKATALLKQHHYQIIIDKQGTTSIQEFLINLEDALENEKAGTKVKKICANDANKEETDGNSKSVKTVQPTVALKMMKLMGWKGSGLGAMEQGIQEPIEATTVVNRSGLGFDANSDFGKSVKNYLNNYLASGSLQKLVFVDFNKEQRAKIHAEAERLRLFTQSRGKKSARELTVRRVKPVITYLHHWVSLIESRRSDPLFKDIIVKPPKGQSKVPSEGV